MSGKYIELAPNWKQVLRFQADHIYRECGGATAVSFIEVVRYLQVTDPEGLEEVRKQLDERYKKEGS